ncbi:MAG: AAA family ATPase, partial [Clostridioides sp.]|nr:AAA family ATPase [Clostridioides sp.]
MKIFGNLFKKINKPSVEFAQNRFDFTQNKFEKDEKKDDASATHPKTTFDDVAGLEEVKEELFEIVDFMKNPKKYKVMGAKIPKGFLFYGPPGTGKTLLASAVAGETNSTFFNITGSEFVEKYVGVGAKRVRTLFEKARKEAPSIIFIDEIDAIGAKRQLETNNEKDQTLNQLLVEMDGFNKDENILIIGATNRLDLLDDALIRPGRFDRHIQIGSPNFHTRYEILKVHTKDKPLDESVNLKSIAQKTHGVNGAHISNIANEAAIFAVRENKEKITSKHFDQAIERVLAGIESKTSSLIEREKKIVSFHESGHALVSDILGLSPIEKISIIPRGQALGYVMQLPDEDRYIFTKEELLGKIKILLAGKGAEEIIFGHQSTGARDDLKKVTKIANDMICEYGMSDLGFMVINEREQNFMYEKINKEAMKIVDTCYQATLDLLNENRHDLEILADYLFNNETMTHQELKDLIRKAAAN